MLLVLQYRCFMYHSFTFTVDVFSFCTVKLLIIIIIIIIPDIVKHNLLSVSCILNMLF